MTAKPALLLYAGIIVSLIVVDYCFAVLPTARAGSDENIERLRAEREAELSRVVDATTGDRETRTLSFGYIDRAVADRGFHLIHDPSLGEEVIVTGPAAALDVVDLGRGTGDFHPEFTAFVRLDEPVEVRLNLNGHGSDYIRLYDASFEADVTLQPRFTISEPLEKRVISMGTLALAEPVTVRAEALVLHADQPLDKVSGTTQRLEILYTADSIPDVTFPNLTAGRVQRGRTRGR